ncbi:MAG: flagellar hook-basal body complex protein FliE, partial [Alphaproteobacteria bacterium]|nr:flagellar hook-basal body complex protein FliE [Alphaproteobacteria bacterium]
MLKSMVDDTVDSLQAGEKATLMAAQGKGNMADVVLAVNNAESLL